MAYTYANHESLVFAPNRPIGPRKLLFLGLFFLFSLAGCTQEALIVNLKNTDVSGTATMFKPNGTLSGGPGSLSLSCTTAVASLHAVNDDGSIDSTSLGSSPIEADGSFQIAAKTDAVKTKSSEIKYVIKASGCGSEFCRPLTNNKEQVISGASTLVCLASNVQGNRSLLNIKKEEITSALTSLNSVTGASTLLDLLDLIIANNSLAGTYASVTGIAAEKLKELPPSTITYTAPLSLHESTTNTYQVSINHWNSSYDVAYQWKLDGTVVGTSASFVYTTGQNSQGSHQLLLTIGSKDAGGSLDLSKPTKSETFNVTVSDDYPAIAPLLSLVSPTASGLPISTRSVTVGIATGSSNNHCNTFSKLALTENSSTPPSASSFTITCTNPGVQSESFTLSSSGDGTKVLRLWALDAAGNISTSSSTLSVDLDTAAPVTSITSTLPTITSSTSQSISFNANDNGGSISYFECRLNAGAYSVCSSPKTFSGLPQGNHTVSVRAIDTAGNISSAVSASWTIDLTAPTLSFSSTPDLITNALSSSFSFNAIDTGGGSIERYECKLDSGAYGSCTSPKIQVLTAGSHTLLVKAFDTAGNSSDVQSYSWTIDTTNPTTTLGSKPAALTNSQSATFTFTGVDAGGGTIASYQCSLDAGAYSSCVSPKSYTGLAAGTHSFAVRAIDSAGNTATAASYSWNIDLSTPMASINSKPDSITNQTSATFSFSANPPPSGSIIGYQCSLDGASYTSCSSPATYSGLSQGSHTFGVKSVDNNSALSAAVTETWTIDTTNPVTTISSGPSGTTNSTTATISFVASDSGGGSIASFECKLNAASYSACSSPVNLAGLSEGSYVFSVRSHDTAGNVGAATTATWTVDLTPPSTTLTSTPNTITNLDTASFSFSASDAGGSSVASYLCSLDGAPFTTCASPKPYSSLSAGAHSFAVKSVDSSGNTESPQSFIWTVDRTNPSVNITSGPPAQSNSTSASFNFSGSDTGGGAIASYECSLDAGSYATCTSPRSLTGLSQGNHTFNVRALDTAGNTSSVASTSWAIDTVAPSLTIATPAADAGVIATSSLSNVNVSGTCETGINVVFSGASTTNVPCSAGTWTASLNFSGLSDGTLSLTATQTDAAGNTTSRTRTFVKDTQAPLISLTSSPSAPQKGGGSFNVGFSVTESNITTAQSFTVSYSSNNGSTWTSAGTVTAVTGPLSSQAFSYALTFPLAVDSTQFRIRVSGTDAAGNTATSSSSAAFILDGTAPVLSSVTINDGAAVSLSPTLNLKVNATDSLSGVSAIRIADASGVDCQSAYANNNWRSFTQGGGTQAYSYLTGFVNGQKQICVWAKDASGNVSEITANSNMGTEGVDMAKIRLDQGNPPVFTSLNVTNGNSSSGNFGTTTFASGDALSISFTVTDDSALATNPVEIYATTDNSTYTLVANAATVGSPGTAQTSWTKTYTAYTAPSNDFFRIRLVAKDANGNTAQMVSAALNSGKWSLFAGNEDIGDGSSALSALLRFATIDGGSQKVVANSRNELFITTRDGIRKIDPSTGNITSYLKFGTYTGIPGTLGENSTVRVSSANNLIIDGDFMYFVVNGAMHRINTLTNEIIKYAGGGSTVSSTDPAALYFWNYGAMTVDPDTKDIYFVNTCNASVTSNNSTTVSVKIQKVTQNSSTKLAQSIVEVAGNCVKPGTITEGGNALSSALETTSSTYRAAHGGLIYVSGLQTLYYAPFNGNLIKIRDGKVYVHSGTPMGTSVRGGVYLPGKNKVYYSRPNTGIYSFTPTASNAFDESFSLEIKPEEQCSIPTCRDSGVSLGNAALTTGSLFRIGDQLGIVDNATNANVQGRLLVLDDSTNTLQTLAGTDRFSGDGLGRTLARFSEIGKLIYKTVASTGFPVGLYASDGTALRILQMDPSQSSIHVRAGNGVSTYLGQGVGFGPLYALGYSTAISSSFRHIAINPQNLFTFYSGLSIWNVKTDLTLDGYLYSASTSIFTRSDGYVGTGSRFQSGEHRAGLIYDGAGNLYFGGYQDPTISSSSSGYGKIMVRRTDGSYYTVIGSLTIASDTDCTVAGCAKSKSVNFLTNSDYAGSVVLGSYDNRYNSNEGRLLFSEQSKIRFVSRAWDPSNSKYGTLADYSGAAVNFGRSVGSFVYTYVDGSSEQIDKVYYVSNDGKLYCKKLSSGADANCTNSTALGPTTGLPLLASSTLTIGPDGTIYAISADQNAIYKYVP